MNKFKIALVQHKTKTTDVQENTALALRYIAEAKQANADFILFPECLLTSYMFPEICETLQPVESLENEPAFRAWCENALHDEGAALNAICQAAKHHAIGVEITAFTQGKKYPQNSAYLIDRNGAVLMKYSKVHTCDFSFERYLESGEEFKVCHFEDLCLGTMICYDREYPESARELMLQGAELILIPNDCGDIKPFRLQELSVAAMQNQVGVAMANPPGEKAGCSCAFHPQVWDCQDNCLAVASESEAGLIYATFDIDALRAYRKREDLGKYRKVNAYRHLCLDSK